MADPISIHDIVRKVSAYNPSADSGLILRAYEFAAEAHEGQVRRSGEPYVLHPLAVADVVADLHLDEAAICAAILHDTVEDTPVTLGDLEERFGASISVLVDGLTKLSKIRFNSTQERQAENFRKMIVAMSRDLRVILVKLADRLHNMRTLHHLRREKQEAIATETLDIYAPLANRLGINAIKQELEDLCFRYLWPDDYDKLAASFRETRSQRDRYTRKVIAEIDSMLSEYGTSAQVQGRTKHLYSIWRKMRRQGIDFEHVYDLLGFRVIVEEDKDCYPALGLVHMKWRPIPGRFKDYIALPKPNGYRSLHTAVVGPKGKRIEIQIRTEEMNQVAEYGVAAHWAYKEGKAAPGSDDHAFNWLKQLVQWQRELKDPEDFLDTLKLDLFSDDVYVFTPAGELRVLPRGSSPVDFAYAIHSEVGSHCTGALVNGRIVPLDTRLRNGDRVEILTRDTQRPNPDWLRFVRTGKARQRIRAYLRKKQRAVAHELGTQLLEKELKRHNLTLAKVNRSGGLAEAARALGLKEGDDVVEHVGFQRVQPHVAVRHMLTAEQREAADQAKGSKAEAADRGVLDQIARTVRRTLRGGREGIRVDGLDNIMVHTAKCCAPVPGDPIVGFVTTGRGVAIHARDCTNVRDVEADKLVEAYWDRRAAGPTATWIRVVCQDSQGKLAEMSNVFTVRKINILSANCTTRTDQVAVNDFEVVVRDAGQLSNAMTALRALRGVVSVDRIRAS